MRREGRNGVPVAGTAPLGTWRVVERTRQALGKSCGRRARDRVRAPIDAFERESRAVRSRSMAAKKTTRKKAAKKKASRRRTTSQSKKSSKATSRKKATAKKKTRGKQPILDRLIYAHARARGVSKAEAARLAGSKGRTTQAQTQAGAKLEANPLVAAMIETIKLELQIEKIDDPWEKAQAVMEAMLTHPEWRARATSANFHAKVGGKYAPEKHEHSGTLVVEEGELANLSADERKQLREVLGKKAGK